MGTDQKINICHLASGDLWAGAEVQVYNMVRALTDYDSLNVSVILLNEGKLADKLRQIGTDVAISDESQLGFLEIARRVRQYCRDNNVAILHTHRYKENIIGALTKKHGDVTYLVQTVHGLPEPFTGLKKLKAGIYGFLNRRMTGKYFDRVLAVSSQIKKVMTGIVPEEKIPIVYNSIDLDEIHINCAKTDILRELGIDTDRPVVGTVGRMTPIKGYDVFLRVAKIILTQVPETMFVLVGDGPLLNDLKSLSVTLGIEGSVLFTGYRNDIPDIINCFTLFLLSSYNEGVPTVILEAMALDKAVVATAVGGVPEVVTDGQSGLLTAPGDEESLAKACLKLITDNQFRQRCERSAQAIILKKFTSKIQGDIVQSIYHQLVR